MRSFSWRLATSRTVSVISADQASGAESARAIMESRDRNLMAPSPGSVDAIMPAAICNLGATRLVHPVSAPCPPVEAFEVGGRVGRQFVALRPPDHLGQALDRLVQGLMALAVALHQRPEALGDARRLVDRELFLERHVQ